MAKNKKNSGVFGVGDILENTKRNIEEKNSENLHNKVTQHNYTIPKEETRSKRIQIVVTPTVSKELDRLVKQKKIKSKNDLINFLLEDFIEQNKG